MAYRQIFCLLIFMLLAITNPIQALDCDHADSTFEMSECGGIEFTKADKELNEVYGKLMKMLDTEGQRRLKAAQRAWLSFRDADADFRADVHRGGTWEPITATAARTDLTRQRVNALKEEMEVRK